MMLHGILTVMSNVLDSIRAEITFRVNSYQITSSGMYPSSISFNTDTEEETK